MKYCLIDLSNLVYRSMLVKREDKGRRRPREVGEDLEERTAEDKARDAIGLSLHTAFESMGKVYRMFGAGHMVVCFDHRSWRKEIYPDYKGNRRPDPDATQKEIEESELTRRLIRETIEEAYLFFRDRTNVTVLRQELLEADDLVAGWIRLHPDDNHFIISTDSDLKQLVAENVEFYNGVTRTLFTMAGVFYQDGIRPKKDDPTETVHGEVWRVKLDKKSGRPVVMDPLWERFVKTMMGDDSDNIKRAAPPGRGEVYLRPLFEDQSGLAWAGLMDTHRKDLPGKVYVSDVYSFNSLLVDLREQPEEILALEADTISLARRSERKGLVGIAFLEFCGRHRLLRLAEISESYSGMLSAMDVTAP